MSKPSNPLYTVWSSMIQRCENPNHKAWKYYGGRGIKVCRRWRNSFKLFLADMAPRPTGMQMDRRDNDKGYMPSNCRWATRSEQHRNRRSNRMMTFSGETMTMWAWAEKLGIKPMTLFIRIKKGWTVEEALSIPPGSCRRVVWRINKSASPHALCDARSQMEKIRYQKYLARDRKPPCTRCKHCGRTPLSGSTVCWRHSMKNPIYRQRYQKNYREYHK